VKVRTSIKQFRVQRGFTQQELARLAGLSRQSLNQIESGATVPSTTVALLLARLFGCRVEDLFELAEAGDLRATLAAPLGEPASSKSARVVVGQVAGHWVAHRLDPRLRPRDLSLAADAVLASPGKTGLVLVKPLVDQHRMAANLLLAGCDTALGLLAERAERSTPGARYLWLEASSGAALAALESSTIHLAGAHLLDEESGDYNVPFVKRAFAERPMIVVTVAQIEEGLAVASGNPKRLRGVKDLARKGVRLVNRDPGAGARRLLDRLLAEAGVRGKSIDGYQRTAPGHLEAARMVAAGVADAAMVTCAAALALGLDFLPLASERFDLVLPKEWVGDSRVARLLETLASGEFRRELASIGGYATQRSGSIVAELH
jgi:molybdate-binding protein/DNA-binding XRE family transcriptional regulator